MISLVQSNLNRSSNEEKQTIVAHRARGLRFEKILDHTQRPCEGDDILAIVFRNGTARFIPNSRSQDSHCDPEAIKRSGIISQYVLPLKRLDDTVFATMQVDLGDLRHLSEEDFRKTEKARVLDCFAEVIGASINRLANAIENDIMLRLDKALKKSLSANSLHEGVDEFIKAAGAAFGAEMGHLWLAKLDTGNRDLTDQTLILETGFNAHDEAEKESWRQIQSNEFSPISQAFRSSAPQIINDVSRDRAWQEMLANIPRASELFTSLNPIKSYAAVALKDECGEPLGAVSFCSTEQWFFFQLHRNALEVLAERLGFIIDHLRAKVRLKFLLDVSPRLAERNLDKGRRILQDVTEDFLQALNAEVASLYLWDEDREKYVLRAQSKWKDERWVHAASYSKDASWIGVQVINEEPLYVPDLRKHYMEKGDARAKPGGRYAEYMFGQPLSETFTVEAIGLPLRIGPEKNKSGVLTLYRPIEKGWASGFITTDIELLQKGAYNAAGLVNAVLRHRNDIRDRGEERGQQAVYKAINSTDDEESFEAKVCRQVLLSFRAVEVDFYRMDPPDTVQRPSWVAGYRRQPESREIEKMYKASGEHQELIKETVRIKRSNKPIYEVAHRRRQLTEEESSDPTAVKTEGLVEQVCIPLTGEKKYLAALVIRWQLSPEKAFLPRVQHDPHQLIKLGRIIGSTYLRSQITREREQLEKEREQADLALSATNAYAAQRAHVLRNTLNMLYDQISEMDDNSAQFNELNSLVQEATNIVNETMELGERVLYPFYERCRVSSLINETLKEEHSLLRKKFEQLGIKYAALVSDSQMVKVDPSHTKDVLFNLINNAAAAIVRNKEYGKKIFEQVGIKYADFVPDGQMVKVSPSDTKELYELISNPADAIALKKKIEKMLVVPAIDVHITAADDETLTLVISDNGIGMTQKEIRRAERGFVQADAHKGVGVLLSRVLLAAQGSKLTFKSEKFKGTDAILTLPSAGMRKTNETAKLNEADALNR